jgi:hypothetical protein
MRHQFCLSAIIVKDECNKQNAGKSRDAQKLHVFAQGDIFVAENKNNKQK